MRARVRRSKRRTGARIFKMDPANPHASLPIAIASLDTYLADHRPRQHVDRSDRHSTRRRTARHGQQGRSRRRSHRPAMRVHGGNAKAQAADANARAEAKTDGVQSADAEIKRLKDELAKANAELERIRKRLTAPPTKPPG